MPENEFVHLNHDVSPGHTFTRNVVPKLPKASDYKAWSELDTILDDSLTAIDYIFNSLTKNLNVTVEVFESRVYDTLVDCCGVHSAPQRDTLCRAKRNQPSKRELRAKKEKASLKRQCKAAKRGEVSNYDKKQLMRRWR